MTGSWSPHLQLPGEHQRTFACVWGSVRLGRGNGGLFNVTASCSARIISDWRVRDQL